jgi:hypothetical protein
MKINFIRSHLRFLPALLLLGSSLIGIAQSTNMTASATNRPPVTRFPRPDVRYEYGPDSRRQEGVPRGKVIEFDWRESKVFPGTIRHCAVYVPAQYNSNQPAALMVFQDGVRS